MNANAVFMGCVFFTFGVIFTYINFKYVVGSDLPGYIKTIINFSSGFSIGFGLTSVILNYLF